MKISLIRFVDDSKKGARPRERVLRGNATGNEPMQGITSLSLIRIRARNLIFRRCKHAVPLRIVGQFLVQNLRSARVKKSGIPCYVNLCIYTYIYCYVRLIDWSKGQEKFQKNALIIGEQGENSKVYLRNKECHVVEDQLRPINVAALSGCSALTIELSWIIAVLPVELFRDCRRGSMLRYVTVSWKL